MSGSWGEGSWPPLRVQVDEIAGDVRATAAEAVAQPRQLDDKPERLIAERRIGADFAQRLEELAHRPGPTRTSTAIVVCDANARIFGGLPGLWKLLNSLTIYRLAHFAPPEPAQPPCPRLGRCRV